MQKFTLINSINKSTQISSLVFFTFTEVLISLAVLSILTSLLIPAGFKTISKARGIVCLNYHKSLGDRTIIYSFDHRGLIPHEDRGTGGRAPLNACWTEVLGLAPYESGDFNDEGYNIKMNSRLEDYGGGKGWRSPPFRNLNTLSDPSLTPYIFDARTDGSYYSNKPFGHYRAIDSPHDGHSNILFLDFSAKPVFEVPSPNGGWLRPGQYYWDPDVSLDRQNL